jgi:hypothetical protein
VKQSIFERNNFGVTVFGKTSKPGILFRDKRKCCYIQSVVAYVCVCVLVCVFVSEGVCVIEQSDTDRYRDREIERESKREGECQRLKQSETDR